MSEPKSNSQLNWPSQQGSLGHLGERPLTAPAPACKGAIVHAYMRTYAYMRVQACTHTCKCICACVCVHAYVNVYMHACVYVCIFACMHVFMRPCVHVCMYAQAYHHCHRCLHHHLCRDPHRLRLLHCRPHCRSVRPATAQLAQT